MLGFTKQPRPIYTEDELKTRENNDDYVRRKIFKDVACFILLMAVGILVGGFFWRYFTVVELRDRINELIMQNIIGIIFFALALIGVQINKGKGGA